MLALVLLSFAACDDLLGSLAKDDPTTYTPVAYTSYGADGTKYVLTITRPGKAAVQLTPAAGDSYTLAITTPAGVTKTSSGMVKDFSGSKFTLTASINVSVSFEVTISGNSMTGIAGTITVEGGVTIEGPGTITPVTGFVAVTNIKSVPTSGAVGTLTLTGTVEPATATNKTIAWSVKSAGGTGAAISGSALTTTATGTVTVTATIANGKAAGTPYTQDFDIVITSGGNSLAGSVWKAEAQETANGSAVKISYTLIFTSASTWAMGGRMEMTQTRDVLMDGDSGTYTASDSAVVLKGKTTPPAGVSGAINGNTIVIYALTDERKDLTFTRQSIASNASLTGTAWKAEFEDIVEAGGGGAGSDDDGEIAGGDYVIYGKYTFNLEFTTASASKMDYKLVRPDKDTPESDSANGTYTVYGNDVVLDLRGIVMGTVNGNTFVLYTNRGITFTKQ